MQTLSLMHRERLTFRVIVVIFVTLGQFYLDGKAHADSAPDMYLATGNFIDECLLCYAFYTIIKEGAKRRSDMPGSAELVEKLTGFEKSLLNYAFALSKDVGIVPETISIKYNGFLKDHMKDMHNSYLNVRIIMEKHGDFCAQLVSDPVARYDYHMKKQGFPQQ